MRTVRTAITALLIFATQIAVAQSSLSALLPMPAEVKTHNSKKAFNLNKPCRVESNLPDGSFLLNELQRIVAEHTGKKLDSNKRGALLEVISENSSCNPEAYTIDITDKKVAI